MSNSKVVYMYNMCLPRIVFITFFFRVNAVSKWIIDLKLVNVNYQLLVNTYTNEKFKKYFFTNSQNHKNLN